MQYSVFIPHRFPGLNDYTGAERTNRYAGAKMKKEFTQLAAKYFKKCPLIDEPIYVQFLFKEPNNRRDPDNIVAFGRKCILDGMQEAGKLENDNMKWITGWEDSWIVDKENPGIEVHVSW